METIQQIVALFLDDSVRGWARVAIFAILCLSVLVYTYMRQIKAVTTDTNITLAEVKSQFHNNGGGSLRDSQDRQEAMLRQIVGRLDGLTDRVEAIERKDRP